MSYNSSSILRNRIISFFLLAFASLLIAKVFFLQVIHGNSYSEKADRQYITPSSNIFERGTIFFEHKDGGLVSASGQTAGFKLAVNPNEIKDPEEIYKKLSQVLKIDYESFIFRASKENDPYEEIIDRLNKEEADAVSALKIPGVYIYKEKWRFYPGEDMAAHVLGFVGYQGDELAGRYGLERQYNNILVRDKDTPYINFFAEAFSNISSMFFDSKAKAGSIVTTIEPTVQGRLDNTLKTVADKYSPASVGGIIMNPQDGSIYAMAVYPSFNPNIFSSYKNVNLFSNPLVENVFEFGSVVKPLVMAAALDVKAVTANTTYNDTGSVIVEKKEIFNFDKKGRGQNVTMQEVLNQSLNTGMVFVYKHLGKENLRNYLLSFDIAKKTGIDLPNETQGLASNLNSTRDIEYANASFGQGIAMTPVEIIKALASLSNGGKLVTPHLVNYIKYEDGTKKEIQYPVGLSKISPETSTEISRMLVTVMDQALKSGKEKIEHYSVAVKTGTAQVANPKEGGYYKDKHLHSFFGYFPAYDPKFIVFLYAVDPKGVAYASETWSDPFLDITKFLLNYYEVPPDR